MTGGVRRLAIVSSAFGHERAGGVASYVEGRARYLRRRIDVGLFALGKTEQAGGSFSVGRKGGFRFFFLFAWCRLLWGLHRFKPDYIEVHNIPVGFPAVILLRAAYFFHGPAAEEARVEGKRGLRLAFSGWLERLVVRRARKVYVVSHAFKAVFLDIYRAEGRAFLLRVRYPKIASRVGILCFEGPGRKDRGLILVCVRRLVKRTGVQELVLAFKEAERRKALPAGTSLHIVGEGPEKEAVAKTIAEGGGRSGIVLHGRLDNSGRDELFKRADWNIVPTQSLEGFGLVVIEAGLCGCPSLVTRVGGLPEAVEALGGIGKICGASVVELEQALGELRVVAADKRRAIADAAERKFLAR